MTIAVFHPLCQCRIRKYKIASHKSHMIKSSNNLHKAVIVISSHVARGSVGNRAAVFALETLSFPVWAIPTIILPWHPGHGPATKVIPAESEFSNFLLDIAKAPWRSEVGAVLSGYMANASQAETVAKLIASLKTDNPNLLYLCDPVIGDIGGLYLPEETASSIRDNLLPLADIVTPNRFELAWLASKPIPKSTEETLSLASKLDIEDVLVTSCTNEKEDVTGNLLKSNSGNWLATHKTIKSPPNGPGDLTAAIHLGHKLDGDTDELNLQKTTASVLEILTQSTARGSDELTLETDAASILQPTIKLDIKKV